MILILGWFTQYIADSYSVLQGFSPKLTYSVIAVASQALLNPASWLIAKGASGCSRHLLPLSTEQYQSRWNKQLFTSRLTLKNMRAEKKKKKKEGVSRKISHRHWFVESAIWHCLERETIFKPFRVVWCGQVFHGNEAELGWCKVLVPLRRLGPCEQCTLLPGSLPVKLLTVGTNPAQVQRYCLL